MIAIPSPEMQKCCKMLPGEWNLKLCDVICRIFVFLYKIITAGNGGIILILF